MGRIPRPEDLGSILRDLRIRLERLERGKAIVGGTGGGGIVTTVQANAGTPIAGAVQFDNGTDITWSESGNTLTPNFTPPFTAKGQLLTTPDGTAIVAEDVGSDGQTYGADSTKTDGHSWTSPTASVLMAYNYRFSASGYQVGFAFSPNNRTFSRKLEPMIPIGTGWENTSTKDPCLLEVDGVLWCYYTGYDGSNVGGIGVSRSYDGGATWTKYASNPILTAGTQAWESTSVVFATVLYDITETDSTKRWKMWYASTPTLGASSTGVGYAYSSDGLNWTKFASNPVIGVGTGWEVNGPWPGAIAKLGSTYTLFYNANGSANSNHDFAGGVATFSDPAGTYSKNTANPLVVGDGKSTTLTSTVNPGDTTINVTDSTIFPIGSAVHIFVLNTGTRYVTHVKSRPTATSFVATDAAPITVSSTGGTVRSAGHNSVFVRSAIYDGGWLLGLAAFQPYGPDYTTLLGETSMLAYASADLTRITFDYTAGLLIRPTPSESTVTNLSCENPSIIFPNETWRRYLRTQTNPSLATLSDVAVSGMADGDELVWSASASEWVNKAEGASYRQLLMQDGVTAPPVPIETEARDDWLYSDNIFN